MNNFQTILTAIFLAFFVFAVLIFSGLIKVGGTDSNSNGLKGKVTVWGTLTSNNLYKVFENAPGDKNRDLYINYVGKSAVNYEDDLIKAFASGRGPDLFIITPDMIINNKNFIYDIPYMSYPIKGFQNNFIDGADVFLGKSGVIALPLVVNPMVMYYNKNMLSNVGISTPPKYWSDLLNLNKLLTKRQDDGTILHSMIALGRYGNVSNSKDIVSTFLLQSGDSIVQRNGDSYVSVLDNNPKGLYPSPFATILNYFMNFSNPSSNAYSWNSSLPNSFNYFTQNKLAFYLGKASDLFRIQSVNPNLSFDLNPMLQMKNAQNRVTYGDIYALAINKRSFNLPLAINVSSLLSSSTVVKNFSDSLSLPPALKSLLSKKPTNPYMYSFYNSAIITKSWVDPDSKKTNQYWSELFNNIFSNKLSVDGAINKTQGEFNQMFKAY